MSNGNVFQAIRTITFKKEANKGGIIVVASSADENVKVKVTMTAEGDDYEHTQLVMDALTAMCDRGISNA